jgi:hypothetical protein
MINKKSAVVWVSLICVVLSFFIWRWACSDKVEGLDAEAGPKYDPNDLGVAAADERTEDILDSGDISGDVAEVAKADQVGYVHVPDAYKTASVLTNTAGAEAPSMKEVTPGRLLTAYEVAQVNENARQRAIANGEFGRGEQSTQEDPVECGQGNTLVNGVCYAPKQQEIDNNFAKGTYKAAHGISNYDSPDVCADRTRLGHETDNCYGNIRAADDQLAFVPMPYVADKSTYKANWNVCDDDSELLDQINTCTQKSEEQDLPRFINEMTNSNKHLIDKLFPQSVY